MSKSRIVSNNSVDIHSKRQTTRLPVRSKPHVNITFERNIEVTDDTYQDPSYRKQSYTRADIRIKRTGKTKSDTVRRESERQDVSRKPTVDFYLDDHYVDSPLIVDSEAKKSAPIKKLIFNIPGEDIKPPDDDRMDWNDYHHLNVIHKFMDDLESDFPSLCTTSSIGTSVEGRKLKVLKISNSNAGNPAVWVDAGIHAREWIAPAVNTYLADHITRNFDVLPDSIRNKDWYFLPVANPDGYHYSHTTDRMWRKNRALHYGERVGVDLNRNFSIGWGGKGSSDNPNNAFYRGPRPFSEPESSAIRDIFLNSSINFKVYITLHSYGQIIIFPYACSSHLAPDYVRLLEGATAMSKAIYKTNGNTYKVGISRDVMYGAAGTSNDFAHGGAGIPYCYLIELRSKKHKFKLPREEIEETGNEILNCVKALMEFVDSYANRPYTEQPVNLLLQQELFSTSSCTRIRKSLSYVKSRESVKSKKSNISVKKSVPPVQKQNSYVRWTRSSVKNINSLEKTSNVQKYDSDGSKHGILIYKDSSKELGIETINSFDQHLADKSISFLRLNNSFMNMTECYKDASDSYLSMDDFDVGATDSDVNRDGFDEEGNSFYKKRIDFYEKRNKLLSEKSS